MKPGQVRKDVVLWDSDVKWFQEHYRDASLSNCLAFLLSEFRKVHGEGSPKIYQQLAANNMRDVINGALDDRRKTDRGTSTT